jgi:hypothetical protein
MMFPHEHMQFVVKREWHEKDEVTVYRWMCPYCFTEGANMEPWVEPQGPYFGIPIIDHIMSCDEVVGE